MADGVGCLVLGVRCWLGEWLMADGGRCWVLGVGCRVPGVGCQGVGSAGSLPAPRVHGQWGIERRTSNRKGVMAAS